MDTCMDTNNNSKDLGDLESLVKMYKEGFLTEEEFKRAKAKILGDSDTKEEKEKVTDELEKGKPESSDNSQENATTGSSKSETPLATDPSEKTASEKNINTEISDKETKKTASSNTEVKKKKNYKKLYWGIGIVAVLALSVCAYLAYLYPTKTELLCMLNNADKCKEAGLDYQEGTDSVKKDENKALKYFEKGCDLDNGMSCGFISSSYINKGNVEKAYKYAYKACDLNSIDGCISVGFMYLNGIGATKDLNEGSKYIERGCSLDPSFCTTVATKTLDQLNLSNIVSTETFDDKTPVEIILLNKACKFADGSGCYILGLFTPDNNMRSFYIHKACELNNPLACQNEASFGKNALRLDLNYKKSIELYTKACNLDKNNAVDSCVKLGNAYLQGLFVNKDDDKGLELLEDACRIGSGEGCFYLGENYYYGNNVNKDQKLALEYFDKSCNYEYGPGCIRLGLYSWQNKMMDTEHERILLNKGYKLCEEKCKNNEPESCYDLGLNYFYGGLVKKDNNKTIELMAKSCLNWKAEACSFNGELYNKGKDVKVDKNLSNSYYYLGCMFGNTKDCNAINIKSPTH